MKLDDSSAAQDSQFCSHGTYRNSSSHFTPFTTFCTSRCPRTQTHNRFVTLRDVVRCDRCNHGVQQMAELSPSGCFIAFANRVDLPLVFFIQIFISAQKQMSLLIHKHLSTQACMLPGTNIGHIHARMRTVLQNSSRKTKAESQLAVSSLRKLLFQ